MVRRSTDHGRKREKKKVQMEEMDSNIHYDVTRADLSVYQ